MYGESTGNDGFGFKPVARVGTVGMRYQGSRAPMFDDTRIFSDSKDPDALVKNLGRDGGLLAQVLPLPGPVGAGIVSGGVEGGYEVVRPLGAGAAPPYDIMRDMPVGAPGLRQANPALGLGAPPKLVDGRSWRDFILDGMPPAPRALVKVLDGLVFKSASEKLGDSLEASGYARPADTDAHHIVPVNAGKLDNIRAKLKSFGISIDDAPNGVFLPGVRGSEAEGAYHRSLHSNDYYNQLQRDFQNVGSKNDAIDVLDRIRGQLLNGTYPGSKPTPPKP